MKPEAMASQMRKRKWDVGYGLRPLCPDCMHSKQWKPNPKPEHQNFKPFVPPQTAISVQLVDAAVKRAHRAVLPKLVADIEEAKRDLENICKEKHVLMMDDVEAVRKAQADARIKRAQEERLARIRQQEVAKRAGAEALRLAKLKERAEYRVVPMTYIAMPAVKAAIQETEKEITVMSNPSRPNIAPAPKISRDVFQSLEAVFDGEKRLYRSGYTDQRVARDCGTSEEVVAYLREGAFGALAEDPRLTSLRDDLELLAMDAAEKFAALQKSLGELRSRVEQIARK